MTVATAPATAEYPADSDVVQSASFAVTEICRQIEQQSKSAEALDNKAAAIFTVTSAAGGVLIGRLGTFDTDANRASAIVAAVVVALLLLSASQALRPRLGFSFGADPRRLVELVDRESHKTVLLSLADALVAAREKNVAYLAAKQDWYEQALRCIAAAAVSIGWMVQTGALR